MRYWRTADLDKTPNYLMHHGIDGQRWGVKHGPPYPLDETTSTGSRLKKRKERETKRANKFKEKMETQYTKRRDKLEKRIHKNPEKENNWLNTRRKYEVNELNDKLNDLKKMSVATLLNMRDLHYSAALGSAGYGAGYGAGMGAGMAMAHSDDFDNAKLKDTLNSFTEDQKKAIAFLMIVLMDELKTK